MTTISPATAVTAPATTPAAKPVDPRLHQAAQAFEAIFVRQMLSAARQGNFGDTLWGDDPGHETFGGMRDEKFADIAAQSGTLGLGRQIERQLAAKGAKP